jgi:uncharacterized protein (TIGR02284 family)
MNQENSTQKTISILQNLMNVCSNVQHLMKNAADETTNSQLKEMFNGFAQQKAEYVAKLQKEILRLGGNISGFSITNEGTLVSEDEESLLQEVRKGEETIEKKYKSAMDEEILWEVIPVLAKQYYGLKESKDRFKILQSRVSA